MALIADAVVSRAGSGARDLGRRRCPCRGRPFQCSSRSRPTMSGRLNSGLPSWKDCYWGYSNSGRLQLWVPAAITEFGNV